MYCLDRSWTGNELALALHWHCMWVIFSRSQDGYCEYMADGTKALLLKKIFSEAEKVLQDYDDGHCT